MSPLRDTVPHRVAEDGWLASICQGSEMGELICEFDWSTTPLGAPDTWSTGLRTAVGVCLSSRFPMLLVWGPDLIEIYNDGYRPILGTEKHPRALGAPAREIWPEIWHQIGPMFEQVMTTGRPTWAEDELLLLHRNGYAEECAFTFSYGAMFDDDGSVGGVLDVVTETTATVLAQRRLACLTALGSALVAAEQVTDVCLRAAAALEGSRPDIGGADLYLLLDDELALVASNRRSGPAPVDPANIAEAARWGATLIVGDEGPSMPAQHAVLPIAGLAGGVAGAIVVSLHPRRAFDADYRRFITLVASTIGSALDNAYRRSDVLGQYQYVSETLQRAMLTPASDLPSLAARYIPAEHSLAVGGDWYDVIDLDDDRRALVVGDCVGHGLDAATVMAQLRSAARAMLLDGRDPAGVLEGLDTFAASTDGALCATVVCAVIDRHRDVMTYAIAGHPPPLVLGADGASWLEGVNGPPLAVSTAPRRTGRVALSTGDLVIMYTDGLVERRGEVFDVGLERLRDAALRRRGTSVAELADGLLADLLPDGAVDDVVLVVKLMPDRASDRTDAT